jgi:DNA-binding CsgD family transcriptional regulator
MNFAQSVQHLSALISTAATSPAEWPGFLQELGRKIGSELVSLHREELGPSRAGAIAFTYGLTGPQTKEYEYYAPRNPLFVYGRSILTPGKARIRQEVCSEEIFLRSEYYNDYLRPIDALNICGGAVAIEGSSLFMLSICGSHKRQPFGESELRVIQTLMPHLQTAVLLQHRLGMLNERLQKMQTAFDAVTAPVLLVDASGAILAANASATRILRARDGLSVEHDRFKISHPRHRERFLKILRNISIAHRLELAPRQHGPAIRVPRPSGSPDWLLQISPVDNRMAGTAIVTIATAEPSSEPSETDLSDLFQLSPAQSQVALRLFRGQSADEISAALRITRNTLKTHMRRAYLKLGVSRQTELIRLLARLKPR